MFSKKIVILSSILFLIACSPSEEEETAETENPISEPYENVEGSTPDHGGYELFPKEDYLERAEEIEADIAEQWENGDYPFENPLTVENPYEISPLSAIALFETEEPAQISLSVEGKTAETTITEDFEGMNTVHQIPILGLYPDHENTVLLTAEFEDGSIREQELTFDTEPLPEDFFTVEQTEAQPERMADGLTYMIPSSAELFAVDAAGDVRFYLTTWMHNNFELLENGHMLVNMRTVLQNDGTFEHPYNHIVELNHLGKPFYSFWFEQYNFDGVGALHHDMTELPNGNWLVLAYDGTGEYVEDEMFEIDKETGEIVHHLNFKEIFPSVYYEEYDGYNAEDGDWFHQNAAAVTNDGEHILSSARNQDLIMKTSYPEHEIEWILAADENWPEGAKPDEYLLEPVGDVKFPMGMHAPHEMPDLDNNPNTMDVMLFDNNRYVTRGHEELHEAYSRAAHYRIDEENMTVEEIWSYGEERGEDYYSWIVGDANYMPETDTVLIDSGKVYRNDEDPVSYITEVTHDEESEVIFEVEITEYSYDYSDRSQIYRAERHPLYTSEVGMDLELE